MRKPLRSRLSEAKLSPVQITQTPVWMGVVWSALRGAGRGIGRILSDPLHGKSIESRLQESSTEVAHHFEAKPLERAGGKVPTLAFLAVSHDLTVSGQFLCPASKFKKWNVKRPSEAAPARNLVCIPNVE